MRLGGSPGTKKGLCAGGNTGFLAVLLLLVSAVLTLTACQTGEGTDGTVPYLVYYLDEEGTGLVGVEMQGIGDTQDMVKTLTELLGKLRTDGEDGKYTRPISQDLEVSDFQIKENQLSVYFTAAYNNKSGLDEILSRAAIVKTLCQVEGIDYVEFYVEDQPLILDGTAVGLMSADNFILDLDDGKAEQSKQMTLYFADEGGLALRSLSAEITYNAAEPLSQMLVRKLIEGPASIPGADTAHMIATIPKETVLNSITIRDNICYVDLGREFTRMMPNVSSDVVVYSIVNTLCELPNVNKVQFSIDGESREKYGETTNFQLPFERNLDLLM